MCHILPLVDGSLPLGYMSCYRLPQRLRRPQVDLVTVRTYGQPIKDSEEQERTFGNGVMLPRLDDVVQAGAPELLGAGDVLSTHLTFEELRSILTQFGQLDDEYQRWLLSVRVCAYAGTCLHRETGQVMVPVLVPLDGTTLDIQFIPLDWMIESLEYVAGMAQNPRCQ